MIFISDKPGDRLLNKLASARSIRVASAFFSPNRALLDALNECQDLTLIVSEEFTFNNPYKLEALGKDRLLTIPTDHDAGKLHAKVFLIESHDSNTWALVGSANLTGGGLFGNQEACIEFDSSTVQDARLIEEIETWFSSLKDNARVPNLELAKKIWNNRSRYRLEPRTQDAPAAVWAIKTTAGGGNSRDYWSLFLSQSVISIGWEDINADPSQLDDGQLHKAVSSAYPHQDSWYVVRTFRNFVDIPVGSLILICRGFVARQESRVHIYGFARITGQLRADPPLPDGEWRFKRDAVIQPINKTLARNDLAEAVELAAMRQTLHHLKGGAISRIADLLEVPVEI